MKRMNWNHVKQEEAKSASELVSHCCAFAKLQHEFDVAATHLTCGPTCAELAERKHLNAAERLHTASIETPTDPVSLHRHLTRCTASVGACDTRAMDSAHSEWGQDRMARLSICAHRVPPPRCIPPAGPWSQMTETSCALQRAHA